MNEFRKIFQEPNLNLGKMRLRVSGRLGDEEITEETEIIFALPEEATIMDPLFSVFESLVASTDPLHNEPARIIGRPVSIKKTYVLRNPQHMRRE